MPIAESKAERIDIRTTHLVKETLQKAAAAAHKNVSEFLLDAGLDAVSKGCSESGYFTQNSLNIRLGMTLMSKDWLAPVPRSSAREWGHPLVEPGCNCVL